MKVTTDFEKEHFIAHVSQTYAPIELIDKSKEHYTALVNHDTFEIHEDIIRDIKLQCQNIQIKWKVIQ